VLGEGRKKILPRMAGIHLSESTVERTTEAVGQLIQEGIEIEWRASLEFSCQLFSDLD
jgi:hypothetical protein